MTDSKIDFSYDNLHFACEGDKDWVESQLNQILSRIPGLSKSETFVKTDKIGPGSSKEVLPGKSPAQGKKELNRNARKQRTDANSVAEASLADPLFAFLKEKNADKNQVKKFLATSVFLHSQGVEKFSTPMVSKLLKASHIEKLINASDCLNKNEKKGFCIKDDKEFILTESGIRSIIGGN